jgi:hypothetical protein
VTDLPPWADGPFELIVHAEMHLRNGDDFDRRIALISFDNSIEVSITTYLTLHPLQRSGREYATGDVQKWSRNYHSKIEFFFDHEMPARGLNIIIDKAHVIWFHACRNEQYHGGTPAIPSQKVLTSVRKSALWIFSALFDVPDVEAVLETRVGELMGHALLPKRDDGLDRLIDETYGIVELAGQRYYTSELLYSSDASLYRETGLGLEAGRAEQQQGHASAADEDEDV